MPGRLPLAFPFASAVVVRDRVRTGLSPVTKLVADEANATHWPSALMSGWELGPSACAPPLATLTRVVAVPPGSSKTPLPSVSRSWTKTSSALLVSPATRLDAAETNAMWRPLALIDGWRLAPLASVPEEDTLTRTTSAVTRSRTKTSSTPLPSPATKVLAPETNARYRPSPLNEGSSVALVGAPRSAMSEDGSKVYPPASVALPALDETVTSRAPAAPGGVVAVRVEASSATTLVAGSPPMVTVVASRFVPVIRSVVPPVVGPLRGDTFVMVGAIAL